MVQPAKNLVGPLKIDIPKIINSHFLENGAAS